MAAILDGKEVSRKIEEKLKEEIRQLRKEYNIIPNLATILIGEDPASQAYIETKSRKCKELGMNVKVYARPLDITQEGIVCLIDKLDKNSDVHGIFVESPLPKHISLYEIMDIINPKKDVDGLHSYNRANLSNGRSYFEPCTPSGILALLDHYGIPTEGKHVVIVGRSEIIGKPLADMMLSKKRNATVTVCHSKTRDLEEHTKQADILVCAIGKPNYFDEKMVKENAVVIDAGVNKISHPNAKGYRLVGDADFGKLKERVSYITPVPGGIGPMTVAFLMRNTLRAAYFQLGYQKDIIFLYKS